MPSRRYHRKSRHGCTTCRERKVRCDMNRPICNNCLKRPERAAKCSFTTNGIGRRIPAATTDASNSYTIPTEGHIASPQFFIGASSHLTTSSPTPAVYFHIPGVSQHDLELLLMHHYTWNTSQTISDDPTVKEKWQTHVPRHALQFGPLMDGIFAISALHLAYLETTGTTPYTSTASNFPSIGHRKLVEVARIYKARALESYIPIMTQENGVSQENCQGIFVFSILLGAICFALIRWDSAHPDTDIEADDCDQGTIIDSVTDVFSLLDGTVAVAVRARPWLRSGDFKPLIGLREYPGDIVGAEPMSLGNIHILEALDELTVAVQSSACSIPSIDTPACLATIPSLAALFATSPSSPHDAIEIVLGTLFAWPVLNAQKLVQLYRQRDNFALILLAFYGAALSRVSHVWFLEGVGQRLVGSISEMLGPGLRSWISVPAEGICT